MERAETFPERDIVLLVTVPRKNSDATKVVSLNGTSTPPVREIRLGEHYRLRLINVHTFRPALRMRLQSDATLLEWRVLAKDGMHLPPDQAILSPSEVQMGNGETYDFDFVPAARRRAFRRDERGWRVARIDADTCAIG